MLEREAAGLKKTIANYKKERRRSQPPLNSSQSVEPPLNIEAELGK
jgi:hypothetical protein